MYLSKFEELKRTVSQRLKFCLLAILLGLAAMALSCSGSKKTVDPEPFPPVDTAPEEPRQPVQKPAPPAPKPPEKPAPTVPLEFQTVYFDFDKSELRSDTRRSLQDNARVLKAYPETSVLVEGHCDERGTVEYNLALGDRRANAVKQYLIDLGIAPGRISTISYGKERPVDPRRTEEAYARNRRAEFRIR